jgi:hypothetical protein
MLAALSPCHAPLAELEIHLMVALLVHYLLPSMQALKCHAHVPLVAKVLLLRLVVVVAVAAASLVLLPYLPQVHNH